MSVLIQQNQHGYYKQNGMASFAEMLYKVPTKSEWNHFIVSVDFLIHLDRGTQREYSSKPLKHSIVKRILVFKR